MLSLLKNWFGVSPRVHKHTWVHNTENMVCKNNITGEVTPMPNTYWPKCAVCGALWNDGRSGALFYLDMPVCPMDPNERGRG